jgi:hypothetical protein
VLFGRNRESRNREAAGRRNMARSCAQENARPKKDSLPNSVRIARKSSLPQNGRRERCEGVVCGRLREYSGETNQWEIVVGSGR